MRRLHAHIATAALAGLGPAALCHAIDLTVASIEVTQGLQSAAGDLPLVARNATLVRAKISLNGHPDPEPGVDGVLRIYANGVEVPGSPVYSSNGPILAPAAPSSDNANDTLNFICLPPEGANIVFEVKVNPFGVVREDSYANNVLALPGRPVLCRRMVDLAYVPVNYTVGAGLPNAEIIEPGNGDGFLRAIYKTGDWNYHRSPLPPLVHSQDINISSTFLLNALNDIRQNQIPAAGFARPEFIYGWLPGNPYIGNGQALTTPGGAAFGNTDPARYQRTFAHEIGHCWGQAHNQLFTGIVGWDIERQLRDPLGLAALMPSTKRDVMVAGLNTVDAWVAPVTYLDAINDARSACTAFDGDGAGGGGPADDAGAVLRIAGLHDHLLRRVELQPAVEHDAVEPTADDPKGNALIEAFDAAGARLHAVRVDTRTCRESCADAGHLHRATALYANLPRRPGGSEIARVVVRECRGNAAGRPLAELVRSAHAPEITGFTVGPSTVGPVADSGRPPHLSGRIRIDWSATDADGDALVADLLYSPDGGGAWIPVMVGDSTGSFEFDASDIPASRGPRGRFDVRVSDGMNSARRMGGNSFVGNSQPPDVHFIAPAANESFVQGASVVLHASAWDIDDQLLPESSVEWFSSLDGAIGVGRLLIRRNLSPGAHTITVRGTDLGGLVTEKSLAVTVAPRAYTNANLDGEGTVGASDLVILLSEWDRTGLGDLDLDGVVGPRDLAELLIRWGT
ncbi:MAG: hypothetical protein RL325_419 [Planctomycetota bacterium]